MSVASNQLGDIHQQLTELFGSHPSISVVPISGDPPNQYQITYNIKGLIRTENGDVAVSTGHLIELTIPFGFPHFPPSCKPKSEIFHPDFDPAAICLGDVWEQDRSLINLIVHIGKLINGDFYSTSNAFNEDAANYYVAHKDKFPLDDPILTPGHLGALSQQPVSDIDTLDDSDLSSDFDFLSLDHSEIDRPESGHFSDDDVDFDRLNLLEKQKNFFELRGLLSEIEARSEEITEYLAVAEKNISLAKNIYKKAREAERSKDTSKATSLYEQVLTTVADYPGVANSLQKLRAKTETDDSAMSLEDELLSELDLNKSSKPKKELTEKTPKKRSARAERKRTDDPFADERRKTSKLPIAIFGTVIFLLIGAGTYYYFGERSSFADAEERYKKCQKEMDAYLFEEANGSCLDGLAYLKHIRLSGASESNELKQKINEILDSEQLRQGLAGNVMIDGHYVPRKDATIIREFRQVQADAESLFHQQSWQKAADKLNEAVKLASKTNYIPVSETEAVNIRLAVVRFRQPFDIGKNLLKDGKYNEAMVELDKAKQHLEKIPLASRETFDKELRSSMTQAQLEQLQQEAKGFFADSNWQEAYRAYDKTLTIAQDTPQLSHRSMVELQTNMARAELYKTIDEGNAFFSSGDWDKAIAQYAKASKFLDDNLSILNLPEAQVSRAKLERVTLQATIIRDKQKVSAMVKDSELNEARQTSQKLIAQIQNSNFKDDPDFKQLVNELNTSTKELDERIYQIKREDYLRDNFKKLFGQMYPTVETDNLLNPVITFVREENGKLIFRMQCQEKGRGRPLTLVMFYAYTKSTGTWKLHIEN